MLVCSSFIVQARGGGGRGGGGSRGGGSRHSSGSRHSGGSSGHGSVRHSGSTHQKERAQPASRTTVGERERAQQQPAREREHVEQPNRDRSDVRKEDIRRRGEEVKVGGRRYYYWGGGYYLYDDDDDDYEEVDPPIGAIVSSLPGGTLGMTIGGQKYYVYRDVYYKPIYQSGVVAYEVVENPE